MLIGVDGNEANVREKVGVSVYTLKHLIHFQKKASKDLKFTIYLKKPPLNDLPDETDYFRYKLVPCSFLWSQVFLPIELIKNKFSKDPIDVFFSPAHYAPRYTPAPCVLTIHDVAYVYYPEEYTKKDLYQLSSWTRYSLKKASSIIAVSKTTKKDIVRFYQIPEERINVIYNGFEKEAISVNSQIQLTDIDINITRPYILYVGTIQPRKNITTLIRAFAVFNETHPDYKLVITGKKGWLFDKIYNEARNLYLQNKIIFTGFINDKELVTLYKRAFCFVLPSLYEGFGIPVLEAMSFGCPVISSFSSSLPEIGGEASLYFDPDNFTDLINKLTLLASDPKLRNELIRKGSDRIKQFSWDRCTASTLKILISFGNTSK